MKLGIAAVLLAILVAVAFTAIVRSADPQPGRALSPAAPVPMVAGHPDGRGLFLRDCAWCHGLSGQGTRRAPTLRHSGSTGADFWLSTGRMPLKEPNTRAERGTPSYSKSAIDALSRYVGTLGRGPAVPVLAPGDVAEGQQVFLANCAACHSSSGTGMVLTGGAVAPSLYPTAPEQVAEAIRLGPGEMPPFGPGQISDQQLRDLVSYVQQLGRPQVRGGASLDQLGPIAEGLLVLLVPLPLLLLVSRLLGKRAES